MESAVSLEARAELAIVKRAPLSKLGVAALAREIWGNPIPQEAYKFSRAIESAHGIGLDNLLLQENGYPNAPT